MADDAGNCTDEWPFPTKPVTWRTCTVRRHEYVAGVFACGDSNLRRLVLAVAKRPAGSSESYVPVVGDVTDSWPRKVAAFAKEAGALCPSSHGEQRDLLGLSVSQATLRQMKRHYTPAVVT